MALGIKSTTKIEEGDILFANGTVTIYKLSDLKEVAFEAEKGVEMGRVVEVTTKYIKIDTEFSDFDDIDYFYLKTNVNVSIYVNKQFDYPDKPKKVTDPEKPSTGGNLWTTIGSILGFGTEVLKKANSTTKDTTKKETPTNSGTTPKDPNVGAAADTKSNILLFVGAGVLLVILLVVIMWKPKPSVPAAVQTTDAPQVIKLS